MNNYNIQYVENEIETDENFERNVCYEVWQFDNYAYDDFYCSVYRSKSMAFRAAHRMTEKHYENGGDRHDYYWIVRISIHDHNELMKELGKTSQML